MMWLYFLGKKSMSVYRHSVLCKVFLSKNAMVVVEDKKLRNELLSLRNSSTL